METTVQEIAHLVGGAVVGDSETPISGITNIETPLEGFISFVEDEKHLSALESSPIACLIVPKNLEKSSKTLIQVDAPKLAWARLLREFYPGPVYSQVVSEQAFIAKTAKLGKSVTVEPFARISEGAEIGDGAVIHSNAFVGDNVKIGSGTVVHPSAVIYHNSQIGSACIIHAGAVIGADGFGYVGTSQGLEKVPQVGNVVIGDGVEIGACTTIDRGTIGSTKIGAGCKIDNLVQIAHNVVIGTHTVISSQTGISGSSKIGAFVTMGGKVGVGDHVEIGDGVMVGAGSGFPSGKKIPPKQIVFGAPARPYKEARRQIAAQWRSAEMYEEIKKLRRKVEALEGKQKGLPEVSS
ncbi:MAG: UDP-3-O-(3-hydroxymyristoyl)glucosamine N-acyltransferase [Candidatus Omnitrophota bacterium]|nr:UDP-3-O-(3-hydroxymyristoyl)glucosamine N-acyltransferase [Candidatus Omnitrophota bacterium]